MDKHQLKDSGLRREFASGMQREGDPSKARFDLLIPLGVPYTEQFLYRCAMQLTRGAEKYSVRNWEKAKSPEEKERFKEAAIRHIMAWMAGEDDEDHAAAVFFNLLGYETTKWKMENLPEGKQDA